LFGRPRLRRAKRRTGVSGRFFRESTDRAPAKPRPERPHFAKSAVFAPVTSGFGPSPVRQALSFSFAAYPSDTSRGRQTLESVLAACEGMPSPGLSERGPARSWVLARRLRATRTRSPARGEADLAPTAPLSPILVRVLARLGRLGVIGVEERHTRLGIVE